jgi:hypothetical protein
MGAGSSSLSPPERHYQDEDLGRKTGALSITGDQHKPPIQMDSCNWIVATDSSVALPFDQQTDL